MKQLKRITPDEAKRYVRLTGREWNWHSKAVAFTMLPSSDPQMAAEGWEDVTYYADPFTTSRWALNNRFFSRILNS